MTKKETGHDEFIHTSEDALRDARAEAGRLLVELARAERSQRADSDALRGALLRARDEAAQATLAASDLAAKLQSAHLDVDHFEALSTGAIEALCEISERLSVDSEEVLVDGEGGQSTFRVSPIIAALDEVLGEVEEARQEEVDGTWSLASGERVRDILRTQVQSLEASLRGMSRRVQDAEADIARLKGERDNLRDALRDARVEVLDAERELSDRVEALSVALDYEQGASAGLRARLREFEDENAHLRARFDAELEAEVEAPR